jgi:hypothetical protein
VRPPDARPVASEPGGAAPRGPARATGALPTRDPPLARLELWIEEFLSSSDSEPVQRTFAHWIVLRRCRRQSHKALLTSGALSHAKAELRSARTFVDFGSPAGTRRLLTAAMIANRSCRATPQLHQLRWLFPGGVAGRRIDEQVQSRRLKRVGVDRAAARRIALLQLAGQIPATQWAEIPGRPWATTPH